MFFPDVVFMYSLVGKIIVLILATILAFPTKSWEQILKNALVVFTVSGIFSGIIFALIFATDFGTTVGAAVSNGEVYIEISPATLICSLLLSYLCIYMVSYIKKHTELQSPNIVSLCIRLFSKEVKINAFCDTGCGLKDPLTGYPVIIINKSVAKKLIPKQTLNLLKANHISLEIGNFSARYRIIPFSTIAGKKETLHGFVPDEVLIDNKKADNCVVAISTGILDNNSQFDAIFNPSLLDNISNTSQNNPTIYERT
jgi:stage II sporulation protein GA (sporulation sigma-E factor processing peptidase)